MRAIRRARATEGGAATVEFVLAVPLVLMIIMLVVQFGIWQHAASVARAAAQEGARTARLDGGTAETARARTLEVLGQFGGSIVVDPRVSATRDDQQASVRVDARSSSVIGGIELPIHAYSSGPVERFRPDR